MQEQKNFVITQGKGFQIKFDNDYIVSVQFGSINYCDNKTYAMVNEYDLGEAGSNNAECAVYDPNGEMIKFPGCDVDVVVGWMSPADVLSLLSWAENQGKLSIWQRIKNLFVKGS